MRPSPVRITKPDGSSHVVGARDFRHRAPEAEIDKPEEPVDAQGTSVVGEISQRELEAAVRKTLFQVMRDSTKLSERTAAATASIKYLAIRYRVGPEWGDELDDPGETDAE